MSGRYNLLTYIRRPSQQSAIDPNDTSFQSNANVTGRTISSSSASSMMSTPSNHLRTMQEQRQQRFHAAQQQEQNSQQPKNDTLAGGGGSSSTATRPSRLVKQNGQNERKLSFLNQRTNTNVKSKLLNLLKSSKLYSNTSASDIHYLPDLVAINLNQTLESINTNTKTRLHKPQNRHENATNSITNANKGYGVYPLDGYDYSVFTKVISSDDGIHDGPNDLDFDSGNTIIKESQIKAWESAEKITLNLIFNESSDSEDDDANDTKNILSHSATPKYDEDIIKSIPGYTTNELNVILSREKEKNRGLIQTNEEEEEKVLWEYRQRHQVSQERIFAQYLSMNEKRKVQIAQKKEFLVRIFGNLNNLNQSFITNNTTYSSTENTPNIQLTFEEDKEEIAQLLEENEQYKKILEDTMNSVSNKKIHFSKRNKSSRRRSSGYFGSGGDSIENFDDFNNEKFQNFISGQLGKLYEENLIKLTESQEDGMKDYQMEYESHAPAKKSKPYGEVGNEVDNMNIEDSEELQSFAISYLRRCIKEELDTDIP